MRTALILVVAGWISFGGAFAADGVELARFDNLDMEEVESQVFSLDRAEDIQVRAVVFREEYQDYSAAWILNARTREVVWESEQADVKRRKGEVIHIEDTVELPAGEYEVYLSTYPVFSEVHGVGDVISRLLRGGFDWDDLEDEVDRLVLTLNASSGHSLGQNDAQRVRELLGDGAIVAFTGVGDDDEVQQGFRISAPMEVEIYAIGEATRDGAFDSAWIVNAKTLEQVWKLDYWNSERAGGSRKNRRVLTTLELPEGAYGAYYATDDSHSWPDFNTSPPHDPMAWGLVIRPVSGGKAERVVEMELDDPLARNVIAELIQVRDDEHRSHGFTLKRPLDVRVMALGEGSGGEMYDYGWIVDALSRKTVWKMAYHDTDHAGGGSKNRIANEIIRLDAGSYIVHYLTDGSHSWRDWNDSPPFQRDRWGITLVAVNGSLSADDVQVYDPADDPAVLARIAEVRDHAHARVRFTLDSPRRVVIYAVGEGSGGEMYDYGWIDDARSGRAVWEMTYRMTEHAGGASKNRVAQTSIMLDAGEYVVHYVSDGSHSWHDWNASPPDDPDSWGISVSLDR